MRYAIIALAILFLETGCEDIGTNNVQADLPVSHGNVQAGHGSHVTMGGKKLPLSGWGRIEVGKPLPSAVVTSSELKNVNIANFNNAIRIINVVPSLDTPVCEKQTHYLSEENGELEESVELITISMDLPFAQSRFAKEAKIRNVTFLSDYKNRSFGNNNGLLIEPLALLTRTVIVVDEGNIVRYLQIVPELRALPDMKAAMAAARALL